MATEKNPPRDETQIRLEMKRDHKLESTNMAPDFEAGGRVRERERGKKERGKIERGKIER